VGSGPCYSRDVDKPKVPTLPKPEVRHHDCYYSPRIPATYLIFTRLQVSTAQKKKTPPPSLRWRKRAWLVLRGKVDEQTADAVILGS